MPRPEKTFRIGGIEASIWAACHTENGEVIKRYTISVHRSYKKDGTWKNTHVLFANDLLNIARVALEAYDYLRLRQNHQSSNPVNPETEEV